MNTLDDHVNLADALLNLTMDINEIKRIRPDRLAMYAKECQEAFRQVASNEIERPWADGIRRGAANALTVVYKLIPVLVAIRDTSLDVPGDLAASIIKEMES